MSAESSSTVDGGGAVAVIGLGYVGLPLLLAFRSAGRRVIGVDTDPSKIEALRAGRSYLTHLEDGALALLATEETVLSVDPAPLADAESILIAVPTPLRERAGGGEHEPDLSYVEDTARSIGPYIRPGQLVSLESTTYPGTTREVLIPILEEASGLKAGEDFLVAYSPERVDPGTSHEITNTPKVVGGLNAASLERAAGLYALITPQVVRVSSLETAEMTKLLENIYRAVNIALLNELKNLTLRMGVDIWEVVDAAATKPFGFQAFYPGPGLGGHCLPIDPFYLSWQARRRYGFVTEFIELAGRVNDAMPELVVERTIEALRAAGEEPGSARVLVVGAAYKPDVGDTRESPGLRIIRLLEAAGARVDYHDPFVPRLPETRDYPELAGRDSTPLTAEVLGGADAVLIATNHSSIDYELIARHARLVVDTRNAMSGLHEVGARIVPA